MKFPITLILTFSSIVSAVNAVSYTVQYPALTPAGIVENGAEKLVALNTTILQFQQSSKTIWVNATQPVMKEFKAWTLVEQKDWVPTVSGH
ncbi:hypothetical protein FPQ18DRAFT_133882 [Pyronema domesticum]|nr:hypothetical protein FPQ18DRAFT_133882 [Pyronema domesticum]